jgi:hypothetical protein
MPRVDIAALRQAAREDRYLISRHAQARMGLRKITHVGLKYSCAFDGNCVYIVTVHRYDAAKWHDPWTRRKE